MNDERGKQKPNSSKKRRRRSRRRKSNSTLSQSFRIEKPDRAIFAASLGVELFPVFGGVSADTINVLPLFRPEDYKVIVRTSELYWVDWWMPFGTQLEYYPTFQISVEAAIDRLEVLGLSLETAKAGFEEERAEQVQKLRSKLEGSAQNAERQPANSHYKITKNISIEAWQSIFRELYQKNIWDKKHLQSLQPEKREVAGALIGDEVFPFGLPCPDQRHFLRLALEVLPPDDDLILRCFIPWDADGSALYREIEAQLLGESGWFDKTVVLTEGKNDSIILNRALKIISPHLAPMFHFMEFQEYGLDGGASTLVKTVKSFAASGIRNRIIALFDNDTAGHESALLLRKERLGKGTLPPNFRVMTLPDIPLAKLYRTIGPAGEMIMDVNGMAAAIELYFPTEALTEADGKLDPVQWTGYIKGMKRYNGSLVHKDSCQKRIRKILNEIEADNDLRLKYDFSGFEAIFDALMRAFH